MPSSTFCKVAATIFAVVALAHAARLVLDLPIHIGATTVPMWVSWPGLFVAGGLSVWGFRTGS